MKKLSRSAISDELAAEICDYVRGRRINPPAVPDEVLADIVNTVDREAPPIDHAKASRLVAAVSAPISIVHIVSILVNAKPNWITCVLAALFTTISVIATAIACSPRR